MSFSTSTDDVRRLTGQAAEMAQILDSEAIFPASELPDIRDALARIRVDGLYLNEEELSFLRIALSLSISAIDFFEAAEPDAYPLLRTLSQGLAPYPLTIQEIDRILGPDGQVRDTASPALANIRQEIKEQIDTYAQKVLDARKEYTDQAQAAGQKCSLADMYDPDNDFLYPKLTAAHKALDKAVEAAYGVDFNGDEEKIVAHLFKLYEELTN